MKTILLLSHDAALLDRVQAALRPGEEVTRLPPSSAAWAIAGGGQFALIALDCRAIEPDTVAHAVLDLRANLRASVCCIGLCTPVSSKAIHVLSRADERVTSLILADHESVGERLRSVLNDVTGTAGAAWALAALDGRLPACAMRIATIVLTNGCQAHRVGDVAAIAHRERSCLDEDLRDEGAPPPKDVIRLARALYAVALLWGTHLRVSKVAELLNYRRGRELAKLLAGVLAVSPEEVRTGGRGRQIDAYLCELLDAWAASRQTASAAGREGDPASGRMGPEQCLE